MLDSIRRQVMEHIANTGVSIMGVGGSATTPPFAYTIGLTATYGVELIIIGLGISAAHAVLNSIIVEGTLRIDQTYTKPANMPLMLKEATTKASEYGIQAEDFYGKQLKFVQVVMCDKDGIFPWQAGYDHAYMDERQPLLFNVVH